MGAVCSLYRSSTYLSPSSSVPDSRTAAVRLVRPEALLISSDADALRPDDGSMKTDDKAEALDRIRNDRKCTIILLSLKCGSVGLVSSLRSGRRVAR